MYPFKEDCTRTERVEPVGLVQRASSPGFSQGHVIYPERALAKPDPSFSATDSDLVAADLLPVSLGVLVWKTLRQIRIGLFASLQIVINSY